MRAMQLTTYDTPLSLTVLDVPTPQAGEIVIKVAACGLNFGDTLMIKGSYQEKPALPVTLGMEMAGTVYAIGEGVSGMQVGMRVAAYSGKGGLAERF